MRRARFGGHPRLACACSTAAAIPIFAAIATVGANREANAQISFMSLSDAASDATADAGIRHDAPISKVVLQRKITFSIVRLPGECLEHDATYVVDFARSVVTFKVCEPDALGVPRWVRGALSFQTGERDTLLSIAHAMHPLPPSNVQMCAADAPDYSVRIFTRGGVRHYAEAMNLCDFKSPYVAAENVYEAVRDVESVVTARRFLPAQDGGSGPSADASRP